MGAKKIEQLNRIDWQPSKFKKPDASRRRYLVLGNNTLDRNLTLDGEVKLDRSGRHMMIPTGKTTIVDFTTSDGGNGLNVANALGRFGNDVTLVTPAPAPSAVDLAHSRGVDVAALRPQEGEGTVKESTILNGVDINGARALLRRTVDRDYTIDYSEVDLEFGYDVLVLSSVDAASWPTIYRNGIDHAKENGRLSVVLPATKQLEAPTNPNLQYALDQADIVGLNREELIILLRGRKMKVDATTPLLDLIVMASEAFGSDQDTFVTDGEHPALLSTRDGRVLQLKRYGEESKTTLGAGDAYAAGVIHALASGHAPEVAMMYGAINGYMTTRYVDSHTGHQTTDQVDDFIRMAPTSFLPVQIFPLPAPTTDGVPAVAHR